MRFLISSVAAVLLLACPAFAGAEAYDVTFESLIKEMNDRAAVALSPETKARIEADWARQEQVTRKLAVTDPKALQGAIARGRLMIADMKAMGATEAAEKTERVLADATDYNQVRWAIRELAFANPKIDFDELVFVKRQWPRMGHQCGHRVGEAQTPGANICVLKGLAPDGELRTLLDAETAKGGVGRFDLSYDAKRIVFPYAKPRNPPTSYRSNSPGHRGGACHMYDVYEIGLNGSGMTNLTNRSESEDTEPCYLPDGRIAFTSSRAGRLVQCGDWALACGIYAMNRDGSEVRRVTEPKEGEFYPSMLEDGRILYTRWDYVMKAFNVIQQLWAVNPDGRGAALVYGDHYDFSRGPIAFFEARQIPGTSKVIATGGAHHNTCAGPIMIVDLNQNRGGPEGMRNVTPEFSQYPEAGGHRRQSEVGWYSSPYPLSDKHYLVSYSFEKGDNAQHGYGIYLADVHGNRELVYRFKGASCYSPYPLKPRQKPRVIPDMVKGVDPATPGTLVVTDIYQGLDGVKRGTVKHLRILETHSKIIHTTSQRVDVGASSGWDVRGVLGTVPVEEDGSVCFELPPYKQVFYEALDEDYLEVRRMRNFMNVMPGEKVSCVGCHEPYGTAPMTSSGKIMALKRSASKIEPPPWGTGGFGFAEIVQPVLNRKCVECHTGEKQVGDKIPFDLTGKLMVTAPTPNGARDQGPQHCVSDSFLNLIQHVSYVQVSGNGGPATPLAAYATGSGASDLMKILRNEDHKNLELTTDEWRTFAAWIDCNAPYIGDWKRICIKPTGKPAPVFDGPKPSGPIQPLRTQSEKDKARIAARKQELADGLLAYIDCGLQVASEDGGVKIRQLRGKGWTFKGSESVAGVAGGHKDITFDPQNVVFEISGLQSDRTYALNLSWWDFNAAGRRQSVWVAPAFGARMSKLHAPTLLPNWTKGTQKPETVSLKLPAGLTKKGQVVVAVRPEQGVNAVLGEMWVTQD